MSAPIRNTCAFTWSRQMDKELVIPPQSLNLATSLVFWLDMPTSGSWTTYRTWVFLKGGPSALTRMMLSFILFLRRCLFSACCVLVTGAAGDRKPKKRFQPWRNSWAFSLAVLQGSKISFTFQFRGPFWIFPCGLRIFMFCWGQRM